MAAAVEDEDVGLALVVVGIEVLDVEELDVTSTGVEAGGTLVSPQPRVATHDSAEKEARAVRRKKRGFDMGTTVDATDAVARTRSAPDFELPFS